MSDYRVSSAGHDIALVSLTVLSPQPRGGQIQTVRRTTGLDSTVYDRAQYVEFLYSMVQGATQYQSILSAFGIQSSLTNDVTVYVEDETFASVRKNGVAVRPQMGRDVSWDRYFPRNIVILIREIADPA